MMLLPSNLFGHVCLVLGGLLEKRYGEATGRFALNTGEALVLVTLRCLDDNTGMAPNHCPRPRRSPSLTKRLLALEHDGLIGRQDNPTD